MRFKKIILIIILISIIIGIGIIGINIKDRTRKQSSNKIQVVVSNFSSYDFLRAIIGDNNNVELKFLLGPGKDAHSYDPTPQELIEMQNADLFVYVGGEMEKWSQKVVSSINTQKTKVICISKDVNTIGEKEIDGAEPEEENTNEEENKGGAFDEHIWTSPVNAIKMVNSLEKAMELIDDNNKEKYKQNSQKYISEIKNIDNQIQEIVNNKVRDRLVFGDRMPMQYFIDYYKLNVSAAFTGCSTETEPSSKTIAYLVNKVKQENIPVVLYIELSNAKVANTIVKETGNRAKTMQIQTLHNVSKTDFDNGETWVSLMRRNIEVLKVALQ